MSDFTDVIKVSEVKRVSVSSVSASGVVGFVCSVRLSGHHLILHDDSAPDIKVSLH